MRFWPVGDFQHVCSPTAAPLPAYCCCRSIGSFQALAATQQMQAVLQMPGRRQPFESRPQSRRCPWSLACSQIPLPCDRLIKVWSAATSFRLGEAFGLLHACRSGQYHAVHQGRWHFPLSHLPPTYVGFRQPVELLERHKVAEARARPRPPSLPLS